MKYTHLDDIYREQITLDYRGFPAFFGFMIANINLSLVISALVDHR